VVANRSVPRSDGREAESENCRVVVAHFEGLFCDSVGVRRSEWRCVTTRAGQCRDSESNRAQTRASSGRGSVSLSRQLGSLVAPKDRSRWGCGTLAIPPTSQQAGKQNGGAIMRFPGTARQTWGKCLAGRRDARWLGPPRAPLPRAQARLFPGINSPTHTTASVAVVGGRAAVRAARADG
jgi:hypothetical protein